MSKLVTILIPVHNREHIIAETLQSALSQTYQAIEVIVIDNASSDNTWQIVQALAEKDHRVKAFRNDINLGPVRNWRRCVDEAMGFYGKILWSDDLITPDYLEKCIPLLDDHTAFVYSGVKIFTDTPESGNRCYFIGRTGHRKASEYIKRALLDKNVPVSPGCALFRMSDLKKNLLVDVENKVDSDFSMHAIGNDLLLFLLTANEYENFGFVAEPLSFFRAHPGSISISSRDGKLPLHYMLVRAYFAERYRKDMIDAVATNAWLLLKKYPKHTDYGMMSVSDFFVMDVKVNLFSVMTELLDRTARIPIKIVRKINKTIAKGLQ